MVIPVFDCLLKIWTAREKFLWFVTFLWYLYLYMWFEGGKENCVLRGIKEKKKKTLRRCVVVYWICIVVFFFFLLLFKWRSVFFIIYTHFVLILRMGACDFLGNPYGTSSSSNIKFAEDTRLHRHPERQLASYTANHFERATEKCKCECRFPMILYGCIYHVSFVKLSF